MIRALASAGRMRRLRRAWRKQAGQTIVEYTLILVVIGIPMMGFVKLLLSHLAGYYGWLTFLETMPLP